MQNASGNPGSAIINKAIQDGVLRYQPHRLGQQLSTLQDYWHFATSDLMRFTLAATQDDLASHKTEIIADLINYARLFNQRAHKAHQDFHAIPKDEHTEQSIEQTQNLAIESFIKLDIALLTWLHTPSVKRALQHINHAKHHANTVNHHQMIDKIEDRLNLERYGNPSLRRTTWAMATNPFALKKLPNEEALNTSILDETKPNNTHQATLTIPTLQEAQVA